MRISIPWQVWASGAILVALFVAFKLGQRDVRTEWKAAIERGNKVVAELQDSANRVTVKVEERIVYRDRIIKEQAKERVVLREVFVPRDSGHVSGGFRLYHDAAATGTAPDTAELPNAAPVAITDLAATIDTNYQRCHAAYARLEGWQEWYAEIYLIWEKANAEARTNP